MCVITYVKKINSMLRNMCCVLCVAVIVITQIKLQRNAIKKNLGGKDLKRGNDLRWNTTSC